MSIINKMHQGLQEHHDGSPILSTMPTQKTKQRVLLSTLISILLASSIGLSYLIYDKEQSVESVSTNANIDSKVQSEIPAKITNPNEITTGSLAISDDVVEQSSSADNDRVSELTQTESQSSSAITAKPIVKTPIVVKKAHKTVAAKPVGSEKKQVATTVKKIVKSKPKVADSTPKKPHLEIKKSVLTEMQLAEIHLKNADKALQNGDSSLAAEEKIKALNLQPQLHDVRQSLALYYYGIGEQQQSKSLLKKGAEKFPEYADFNLMLARIALKNDEQQRAYLYLQQHPPAVEGNLDYHVSYAILAQKFKHYQQAENLYMGLLSQRPNNGRWRMSLAIAQDKQDKQALAIESYQKALMQVDLSGKAKKYINQRLTYLANQ